MGASPGVVWGPRGEKSAQNGDFGQNHNFSRPGRPRTGSGLFIRCRPRATSPIHVRLKVFKGPGLGKIKSPVETSTCVFFRRDLGEIASDLAETCTKAPEGTYLDVRSAAGCTSAAGESISKLCRVRLTPNAPTDGPRRPST